MPKCKGIIRLESGELDLTEDCIIVLPPGLPHSYNLKRSSGTIGVYHFLVSKLPGAGDGEACYPEMIYLPVKICPPEIFNLLSAFERRGDTVLRYSGNLLLLADIIQRVSTPAELRRPGKSPFLRRIVDYTERNYAENLGLEKISSYAGVSKYHFCRLFKKMTGENWNDYLRAVRLANSRKYLLEGASVSDTAACRGFDSDSYFISCFKKEYSATPLQWGKLHKGTTKNCIF